MFYFASVLVNSQRCRTADLADQIHANVGFQINNADESYTRHWRLDLKVRDAVSIREVAAEENSSSSSRPNVLLVCSDMTFLSLTNGSLSPEFAYMRGLLKIKGQMAVAMKVKALLSVAADIARASK